MPPEANTRSLGTVAGARVHDVRIDDSHDRRQFRLDFADTTGREYPGLPINDLAFRNGMQKSIEMLGEEGEAEERALRAVSSKERIYLRIGLSRPEQLGDHPLTCWSQVTGIYTFPDYLEGKTFADFV